MVSVLVWVGEGCVWVGGCVGVCMHEFSVVYRSAQNGKKYSLLEWKSTGVRFKQLYMYLVTSVSFRHFSVDGGGEKNGWVYRTSFFFFF